MRLSERTIQLLKNFNTINQSLVVDPGHTLTTVSKSRNILASVEVAEEFETPFAVYEINRFLGILSLYEKPDITFGQNSMTISEGKNSVNYVYADRSQIVTAPKKEIKLPSVEVELKLGHKDLEHVLKGASILGVDTVAFVGDGETAYLKAYNEKNPTSDSSVIELGKTDKEFTALYKTETLKLLPIDYDVRLCEKGISHFEGQDGKVNYWIALESNSDFTS